MPLTQALRRQKQRSAELEASPGHIARACLKNKQTRKRADGKHPTSKTKQKQKKRFPKETCFAYIIQVCVNRFSDHVCVFGKKKKKYVS